MKPTFLTLEAVLQARSLIADGLRSTPCATSAPLSALAGMEIILKHDYRQATGSFKERGARHALSRLNQRQRTQGVVAASAGNHALGLAWHGRELGIAVTVVMPIHAPRVKAGRCLALGAKVIPHGETFDEAEAFARKLAREQGLAYIHPFDDLHVAAGQGTLALEILESAENLDAIVVPVGGGGLLAGIATVVKALRPEVEIIGVEPMHAACLNNACHVGRPVITATLPSLADGLSVARIGKNTFREIRARVDHVITVSEIEIAQAMLALSEHEDAIVEGAGCTALAACLSGRLGWLAGKRVAVPLTGANVDPSTYQRALHAARSRRDWLAAATIV